MNEGERTPSDRLLFHLALAGIFFPLVLPVIYAAAFVSFARRKGGTGAWTGRLWALATADALVGMILIALALTGLTRVLETVPAGGKGRIGITLPPGGEPRIRSVLPGSPAEQAGLRAGDLVLEVDGSRVTRTEEVIERVGSAAPGTPVRLAFERDGARREADVVPVGRLDAPARGLFDPGEQEWGFREGVGPVLAGLLPALLFAGVMGLRARGRTPRPLPLWAKTFAALLVAGAAALGATYLLYALLGAATTGGLLLGMLAQTLALAGMAKLWGAVPDAPAPAPGLPAWKAVALGALYLASGAARLAVPLRALDAALGGGAGGGHPIEAFGQAGLGGWGIALFVLTVAVAGPWAEELLFRGFLFSRLLAQGGSVWAVWVSAGFFALIHPNYKLYIPIVFYYALVLGWARLRTGGLAAPVILHMLVNGVAAGFIFLRG